jgi:hypothetical protein
MVKSGRDDARFARSEGRKRRMLATKNVMYKANSIIFFLVMNVFSVSTPLAASGYIFVILMAKITKSGRTFFLHGVRQ